MPDTSTGEPPVPVPLPALVPAAAPASPPVPVPRSAAPVPPAPPVPAVPPEEARGCLFALSQPPLMIFLTVIGTLLLFAAVHDLFLL
ncbi:hypothetical protein [Streptomyces sp. PvR034]|uniref:hypothetical protein n=1 Tax=Streptomyces sp. PvR034 TaxID=3156401 RepID=UPI00339351B2